MSVLSAIAQALGIASQTALAARDLSTPDLLRRAFRLQAKAHRLHKRALRKRSRVSDPEIPTPRDRRLLNAAAVLEEQARLLSLRAEDLMTIALEKDGE